MTTELLPCPFCGHEPHISNLIDSLKPSPCYKHYDAENDIEHYTDNPNGAIAQLWEMHCLDNEGGCSAQVIGEGKQGAINAWNRRPEK